MSTIDVVRRKILLPMFWLAVPTIVMPLLPVACGNAAAQDSSAVVRLTIDYGDGMQKTFSAVPWKEKMTVFDALQAAEKHPRGIKLAFTGRGETIFVTAIDDAANEGADGRN